MADITIQNTNKNNLTITNTSRTSDSLTWNTITGTWDEHHSDTWESPRMGVNKNTKNSLTINNQSKN